MFLDLFIMLIYPHILRKLLEKLRSIYLKKSFPRILHKYECFLKGLSNKIVHNILLTCDGKLILTHKTILSSDILQLKFMVSGTIHQPSRSVALDIEKMKESCYVYSFFYT